MKRDGKRKRLYFEGRAFSSGKAMCSYTILKGLCSLKTCGICFSFIRSNSRPHCHFHISSINFRGSWARLRWSLLWQRDAFPGEATPQLGLYPLNCYRWRQTQTKPETYTCVCCLLGNLGQNTKLHLNYRLRGYITYRYNISTYLSFSGHNWIHLENIK